MIAFSDAIQALSVNPRELEGRALELEGGCLM